MQFYLGTQLLPEGQTQDFPSHESALCSPLAIRLFDIEGVKSAFFGGEFISINKVPLCEDGAGEEGIDDVCVVCLWSVLAA